MTRPLLRLVPIVCWLGCGGAAPLGPVSLTSAAMLAPQHAIVSPPDVRKAYVPAQLQAMLGDGYGQVLTTAGEPYQTAAPPGMSAPAPGANPSLLVRFVHLADPQLVDDESPSRDVLLDSPVTTDGAFRPQEADQCRILDAAVRTINQVHAMTPLSFVLLGGDNADNAQSNEEDWFLSILDGAAEVKCDSGAPDDPVPGPDNDGKDPFQAAGLRVPWYWVTGNHDVLVQGNFPVSAYQSSLALGDGAPGGTRDWSQPGGPVITTGVIPDARRQPLTRAALMAKVAADGAGHGLGAAQVQSGKAFYTFDVPGTPLRFLVLDTCAETGGADGMLHQADVTSVVRPLLDQAKAQGKWVVLASHHSADSLNTGGGFGGVTQPDALLEPAWTAVLADYPNVLFSMTAHAHAYRVRFVPTQAAQGLWEVQAAALADFPHQMRVVELWDQDNGWLMMRATGLDYATAGDGVAADGRALGVADYVSGWWHGGSGAAQDRDVELWIPKPQ